MVRAPMGVRAVATSEQSVEVWWETVPSRTAIIAYQIFYTMTAVEDLDQWHTKVILSPLNLSIYIYLRQCVIAKMVKMQRAHLALLISPILVSRLYN